MEEPLYIFEATKSGPYTTLIISLGTTLLTALAAIWLHRKAISYDNRTRIRLLQVLLYFVILIAAGTAVFTTVQLGRLQPIKIYEDRLETAYGTVPISELEKVQLYTDDQRSFVSPDIEINRSLLLYVEEKNGDAYVFAKANYDVRNIINILRPMMDNPE